VATSSPRLNVFGLALVCSVLVVIGCLSTWAHWNGRSFGGTDVNAGKTTLVAAIIAAVLLLIATWRAWRWAAIVAAIPAGVAAAIAAYRLADIANFVEGSNDATAAWGIWMATIAACALLALCLVHAVLPKRSTAPASAAPPAAE
jgi:hypothetical protein